MEENYVLLTELNFDFDTNTPTIANNIWKSPQAAEVCSYGFTATEPIQKRGFTGNSALVSQWNEYGFYKTANVGLSRSNVNGYKWWNDDGIGLYDRLYDLSNKTKNGYLMYIDAAQTPGVVAKLPIGDLCSGTKLFVSAGIASLTSSGNTSYPNLNLVFLGIDANGNETELNRYTSGDIPSSPINNIERWHQLYYTFDYENPKGENYVSYRLQVENNCTSTSGGDYAVDDIRVYRSKPAVQANQVTLACGTEEPRVKIRVEYEKLLSTLGITEITGSANGTPYEVRYKFLDLNKQPVTNYNYGQGYISGSVKIYPNFSKMVAATSGNDDLIPIANGDPSVFAYTETENIGGITYRYIVFQTPNNGVLKQNVSYYSVIANASGIFETGLCSMISDAFVIQPPARITLDGSVWKDGDGMCYGNSFLLGAKLLDRLTHEEVECRFDWFIGTAQEFEDNSTGLSVKDALSKYRSEYGAPGVSITNLQAVTGVFTQLEYDRLSQLINEGKLILNKAAITRIIRFGENILAVPITGTALKPNAELCPEYLSIYAGEPHKNPTLEWLDGFGYSPISIRMGLEQWKQLQNDNTKSLKIPVDNFANTDVSKIRELIKATNTDIFLLSTDVPGVSIDSTLRSYKIAQIKDIHVKDGEESYLVFEKFTVPSPLPADLIKEGYTYKAEFFFNQKKLNEDAAACDGVAALLIKIVPEYQTWTGTVGDNWNNDANWKRSTVEELFKTGTNSDSYANYSTPLEHKGFTPMGFTKVTIPSSSSSFPWLYTLPLKGGRFKDMDNTNYNLGSLTEAERIKHSASTGIEYEREVNSSSNVFLAELFTGNRTAQLFVRHGAEIRNTDVLAYDKAWIDFELDFDRWYLLASPLQGVVAGDFYLPSTNGRQETESFQPILYSTSLNNRFSPAVWQRSWNMKNSLVYKKGGGSEDAYVVDYVDWSWVYNKVEETYKPGYGFSVKPDNVVNNKVLFRLPKGDTQYMYYSYNTPATGGNNTTITRTNPGKFQTIGSAFEVTITNETTGNNLFLVGNPFMATLDMEKFFQQNTGLEKKYWILTAAGQGAAVFDSNTNNLVTSLTGAEQYIAPIQGFFVKGLTSDKAATIKFTPDMVVEKPAGGKLRSTQASQMESNGNELLLKAERNGYQSSILIVKRADAENEYNSEEDVELLLDSNLSDVPSLYSVAGDRAAIINVQADSKSIPLGVYGENNELVTITISGAANYAGLSLYDSETGIDIPVNTDSVQLVVEGNTHARYLLRFSGSDTDEHSLTSGITVYSPEKGKIVVATDPDDELQSVRIYSFDGRLVRNGEVVNNVRMEYAVPEGIYLVQVKSVLNNKVIKVAAN